MQTSLRRGLAAIATSALALGALSITAPAQAATVTDPAPARATAAWLVKNLNADGLVESYSEWEGTVFSGPSYGTSVDLAEGLAQVGGQQASLDKAVASIEKNLAEYVGKDGETYSGSLAKAVALLHSQGRDVTAPAARLAGTVTAAGPAAGRLADTSQYGDYANTIGQAYAARALTALGSPQAEAVTDFLLAQQCDAGFFRLYFNTDKTSAAQSCDTAPTPEAVDQSADTTALVIIQTTELAKTDPEVRAARAEAAAWLAAQQKADGSFVDPVNGANANTTGLAGWALAAAGQSDAAARAAVWLRGLQVAASCAPGKLAGENGAVAYNAQSWTDGLEWGITDKLDRSQWVIADVQALPALLAAPANTTKDAVVLPTFAKAGSNVTAVVKGIAAGERVCATGSAGTKDLLGTGKDLKVTLAKAKSGTRTITLKTASGSVKDSVKVLGKKKLTVKAAKSAKRGSKKTVTIKGLAAGEKITVKVKIGKAKTKTLKVAKAGKKGTYALKIKVGTKRGTVKVAAYGQYSNRKGSAKVTVK